VLDVLGGKGSRTGARRLVGLGVLAVPITAATGLADWSTTSDARVRRVGAVHAIGNGVVGLAYLLSWRARRRGAHLRGKAWGFVGAGGAWITGYLGGHLSFGRGVGVGERGLNVSRVGDSGPPLPL
jgi:MFS family permease